MPGAAPFTLTAPAGWPSIAGTMPAATASPATRHPPVRALALTALACLLVLATPAGAVPAHPFLVDVARFDALYDDLEQGRIRFEDAAESHAFLERLAGALPPDDPLRQQRLDLVRCYFDFDGRPVERLAFAREGLARADALEQPRDAVHWLHCKAAALEVSADPGEALEPYREALDRANAVGDPYLRADAMTAMSGLLSLRGQHGEALGLLVEGQQLFEAAGRNDRASALQIDIGLTYRRIGRLDRAEEILRTALADIAAGDPDLRDQHYSALMQLGFTLHEQDRQGEALEQFEAALAVARAQDAPFAEAGARMGMAWSLIPLGRFEEAMAQIERGADVFTAQGDASNRPMLDHLRGRALAASGDADAALALLESAAAQPVVRGNPRYRALNLAALAEVQAQLGQYEAAYATSLEHLATQAELQRNNQAQQLTLLQAQLDIRGRTAEIERLLGEKRLREAEIEALQGARRWQALALGLVTVLALLLVAWGIRQIRRNRDLYHQASTDPLTRVANRRAFLRRAIQMLESHRAQSRPMSVVGLDLDHFKQLNDRFGHAAGDQVLAAVADRLQLNLRTHDLLGRLGGEEFAIALPDTRIEEALQIAERLREGVEALPHDALEPGLQVTVSLGVASLDPDRHGKLDDLLEAADRALYRAKAAGRNRVLADAHSHRASTA